MKRTNLLLLAALALLGAGPKQSAAPAAKELPIDVIEDRHSESLHLWRLYERSDATAVVGDEIAFVGRLPRGENEVRLEEPPWLTVAFSKQAEPGTDQPKTLQTFSLLCDKPPRGLDATGFVRCTGKLVVNRPELSTEDKHRKNIAVFRIELSKTTPLACRRSLDYLQKLSAVDIRRIEPRLRKLCDRFGLKYAFDAGKLSRSWYKGRVAFTSIVSQHPGFSFKPVPYATISALYYPESGEAAGFVFARRLWQDPPD